MTNEQKKMKKYMTAIERRLNLPREVPAGKRGRPMKRSSQSWASPGPWRRS